MALSVHGRTTRRLCLKTRLNLRHGWRCYAFVLQPLTHAPRTCRRDTWRCRWSGAPCAPSTGRRRRKPCSGAPGLWSRCPARGGLPCRTLCRRRLRRATKSGASFTFADVWCADAYHGWSGAPATVTSLGVRSSWHTNCWFQRKKELKHVSLVTVMSRNELGPAVLWLHMPEQ